MAQTFSLQLQLRGLSCLPPLPSFLPDSPLALLSFNIFGEDLVIHPGSPTFLPTHPASREADGWRNPWDTAGHWSGSGQVGRTKPEDKVEEGRRQGDLQGLPGRPELCRARNQPWGGAGRRSHPEMQPWLGPPGCCRDPKRCRLPGWGD